MVEKDEVGRMKDDSAGVLGALMVVCADGKSLAVEFVERGDRVGHVVLSIDAAGKRLVLAESSEGAADDDWPASPPLQNLSIETLTDGRQAAFLVGMAGGSHWSASVEAIGETIVFDIACRHGDSPGPLGSRYRLLETSALQFVAAGDATIEIKADSVVILPCTRPAKRGTTRWRCAVGFACR